MCWGCRKPPFGRLLYSEFGTPFDMAAIANSMGVHGERITDPSEIKPAVDRGLRHRGNPRCVDIVIVRRPLAIYDSAGYGDEQHDYSARNRCAAGDLSCIRPYCREPLSEAKWGFSTRR